MPLRHGFIVDNVFLLMMRHICCFSMTQVKKKPPGEKEGSGCQVFKSQFKMTVQYKPNSVWLCQLLVYPPKSQESIGPQFQSDVLNWMSQWSKLAWIRRGRAHKDKMETWSRCPKMRTEVSLGRGSKVIHPKWWKGNVGTKLFTYLVLLCWVSFY